MMDRLATFWQAKARWTEAEPLFRRALAINEASLGNDHPKVATGLNNLAGLLQDTNRLAEAEPLSRAHMLISLRFTRKTGHPNPHLQAAIGNYSGLLSEMGLDQPEIDARLAALHAEAGIPPPPHAEPAP